MITGKPHLTEWIKEAALRHGFMGAGISKAQKLEEEALHLEAWLNKNYHGQMAYMANHFDLRIDPTKLVPGAKSVISLMYNYYPGEESTSSEGPSFKISRYAYGEDYHKVVRRKLKTLVREMKSVIGDFHARVFVDSAPLLERDWAKRSGLGWTGKNTLLIHPKKGSYFFLAEIVLDVELDYDQPIRDHCGTCTRCIDACPTEAISPEGYLLDGSKCISYLTIELKDPIPEAFHGSLENWIFGCDICQEVCPWNRFAEKHTDAELAMNPDLKGRSSEDWLEITDEVFGKAFEKSPLKRAGLEKLKNTMQIVHKRHKH